MKYDVAVIGGSAGGLTAAISAKRFYPDKSVLVIKKRGCFHDSMWDSVYLRHSEEC